MTDKPIDVVAETQAVVVREQGGAVGYALSLDDLHRNLEYVRDVMRKEMREGQDYGKIPGTGDKPTLLQPGAQKLLMTFNLVEKVKREVLRDFPNFHREYEFTLTVCASNGKEWDGVGTCSTLEAKYRYRKAERKCPKCGKHTIIAGKEEYGGGWVCFKKKGGCGEKFAYNDQSIQSQQVGRVEHDNPPDYWNTVRKMAFKRALVHASINATNTSDLWTQDIEEMSGVGEEEGSENAPERKSTSPNTTAPAKVPEKGKSANPVANGAKCATPEQKVKLLEALAPQKELAERYMKAIDWLFPTESIQELSLAYVPVTKKQFDLLMERLEACKNGEPAVAPYPPNPTPDPPKKAKPEKPIEVRRDPNPDPNSPDAPWRSFPVPFGKHAGVKLAELDKGTLFGFWANFTVEREYNGKPKSDKMIERDEKFREMLDSCGQHYGFKLKESNETNG